jgi:uncharacterized protein
MDHKHVPLSGIPASGLSVVVSDQEVWLGPLRRFAMDCRIADAVTAEVMLVPQDSGCLIRGKIRGKVILPCNRCLEDTIVALEHDFDEFEAYPDADGSALDPDSLMPEESLVTMKDGLLFLDLASLLWEEFSLALPDKPLCRSDCKGLCPSCGHNLNLGQCGCAVESGDSRFEVLRNYKVDRQA